MFFTLSALALALISVGAEAQITQFTDSGALRAFNLPGSPSVNVNRVVNGDFDGDGDLDIVLGTSQGVRLILNGASSADNETYGTYTDVTAARLIGQVAAANVGGVAMADGDGDGDLDIFATYALGGRNVVFYQNLGGSFANASSTRMPLLSPAIFPTSVAAGDVDGDGDVDLAVGTLPYLNTAGNCLINGQTRLLINNGTGFYSDGTNRMPGDNDNTADVTFGDMDGDGDLDLLMANPFLFHPNCPRGGQNRLYLNNGSGTFSDVTATAMQITTQDVTQRIAVADIYANGSMDFVAARLGQTNRLYTNNASSGTPDFRFAFPFSPGAQDTVGVAVGDVDSNGRPDIVFGNTRLAGNSGQTEIWLNTSGGTWQHSTSTRMPADSTLYTGAVALADSDRDEDLDLLVGNIFNTANTPAFRMYANLHRQIDSDPTVGLGQTLTVDVYHEPGYGTAPISAALYASFLPQVPRVSFPPFGEIGIDLTAPASVLLGPFSGLVTHSLAVPNDPNLIGVSLFWQGLMIPTDPNLSKLTNVIRTTVQ